MVHALDRSTGKSVWTFLTRARVESSPLVAGSRVFVGSNDGHFYSLDMGSGKKLWDFTAGAPLSASPAAAEGADCHRLTGRSVVLLRRLIYEDCVHHGRRWGNVLRQLPPRQHSSVHSARSRARRRAHPHLYPDPDGRDATSAASGSSWAASTSSSNSMFRRSGTCLASYTGSSTQGLSCLWRPGGASKSTLQTLAG